jgi:hypothetical protein
MFDNKKNVATTNNDSETSNDIFSTCNDMTLIFKDQRDNQVKNEQSENENLSTMITKKDSPKEDFNTIKTNGNEDFETFKYNDESMSSSFGTMIIKDDVGTNVTKTKPSGLKKSESQFEKIFVNDYVPKTLLDSVDGQGLSEMARAKILIRNEVKYFDSSVVSSKSAEEKTNFLYNLTSLDMQLRLKYIDSQMEDEIKALKLKYEQKRQVILEAVELKKKNSNVF